MSVRRAHPVFTVDPDAVLADATRRLAANVRERRKAVGLSQERLAEMARLSTIYLGQLERGTAGNPSLGVVAAIAAALQCQPGELLLASVTRGRVNRRARSAQPEKSGKDVAK